MTLANESRPEGQIGSTGAQLPEPRAHDEALYAPAKRGRAVKVLALLGAGVVGGGGLAAVLLTGGSSDRDSEGNSVSQRTNIQTSAKPNASKAAAPSARATSPAVSSAKPSASAAASTAPAPAAIPKGVDTNTSLDYAKVTASDNLVERPGGRKMLIPVFKHGEPNVVGDIVVTQLACVATVAEENIDACLGGATYTSGAKASFVAFRDLVNIDEAQQYPDFQNAQVEFMGDAQFKQIEGDGTSAATGRYAVRLAGGALLTIAEEAMTPEAQVWQAHTGAAEGIIDDMTFTYEVDKKGAVEVTALTLTQSPA